MSMEPALPGMPDLDLQPTPQPVDLEAPVRLRRPDRRQVVLQPLSLEQILSPGHEARIVWALVENWDLSGFLARIKARGNRPGRAYTDPKLLIALWLYAYSQGVGCGRELDELCRTHDAYRWLCGGVSLNYHTLNDFRVEHEAQLDELLSRMIDVLIQKDLVDVYRISQDGTRVRASAGSGSFKTGQTLQEHLQRAKEHVEQVKAQASDPNASKQKQMALQRAAKEKLERVEQAIQEAAKVQAAKDAQKKKPTKENPAKASMSDPEARYMRMSDGGSRPAYNVQFATANQGRAIVGVQVSNSGSDAGQDEPMRQEVQQRAEGPVREHLIDGGYVDLEQIEKAAEAGVTIYMPVPKPRKKGTDPHQPKRDDSAAVAQWRVRMGTPEAKAIYKQRAATSETVNAETKTVRGLNKLVVRGLKKVRCIALWSALAYNLAHFGMALLA